MSKREPKFEAGFGPAQSWRDRARNFALDKYSIVKCIVSNSRNITKCFRYYKNLPDKFKDKSEIRKILGLIAYQKDFLDKINNKP